MQQPDPGVEGRAEQEAALSLKGDIFVTTSVQTLVYVVDLLLHALVCVCAARTLALTMSSVRGQRGPQPFTLPRDCLTLRPLLDCGPGHHIWLECWGPR